MTNKVSFSANLGFLFADKSLPEAIDLAARSGFEAVELHWPFHTPSQDVGSAAAKAGIPILGLNVPRGSADRGENGLCALSGREEEARHAITQALDYAHAVGARFVHAMAGRVRDGADWRVFTSQLRSACESAQKSGISIVIEPLNPSDAPDYLLASLEDAADVVRRVGRDNLKIMFDCYHLARLGYEVVGAFRKYRDLVAHVQIASVPQRAEPDRGQVDYDAAVRQIAAAGYRGFFGAEYKPQSNDFGWMMRINRSVAILKDQSTR